VRGGWVSRRSRGRRTVLALQVDAQEYYAAQEQKYLRKVLDALKRVETQKLGMVFASFEAPAQADVVHNDLISTLCSGRQPRHSTLYEQLDVRCAHYSIQNALHITAHSFDDLCEI